MSKGIFLIIFLAGLLIAVLYYLIYKKNSIENDLNENDNDNDILRHLNEDEILWSRDSIRHKYLLSKYSTNDENEYLNIYKLICPSCLKTVLFEKLNFICPFCDSKYDDVILSQLKDCIFDECLECGGKIQYIECYYCQNPIDLFAPYDESELEKKRYVK